MPKLLVPLRNTPISCSIVEAAFRCKWLFQLYVIGWLFLIFASLHQVYCLLKLIRDRQMDMQSWEAHHQSESHERLTHMPYLVPFLRLFWLFLSTHSSLCHNCPNAQKPPLFTKWWTHGNCSQQRGFNTISLISRAAEVSLLENSNCIAAVHKHSYTLLEKRVLPEGLRFYPEPTKGSS